MPQTKTGAAPSKPERTGGVKSVDRAIDLLELLADYGGESTLSELAEQTS
ncbi:MAG TPA: helix-turn-helix domain-containing protein, partial [Ruania sp.]|nr:helix-turn-helix domain-containing protein [Ruania sp.]